MTSVADARAAAEGGADAIGLVFYAPSPRCVDLATARRIAEAMPPFVTRVALFVNPHADDVRQVLDGCPIDMLQFHGDEAPGLCAAFGKPFLKALRVRPERDLLEYFASYGEAAGWLLDAFHPGLYGGTGSTFDWDLIPQSLPRPLVLSGGLTPENVADAIRRVRPWAVDVSSGVESSKGVKDAAKVAAFIAGVRNADV